MERELRQYLDQEELDTQAKADQAALVNRFGGRDKAFRMGAKGATPVPGRDRE
jgi:choline-sulfatase